MMNAQTALVFDSRGDAGVSVGRIAMERAARRRIAAQWIEEARAGLVRLYDRRVLTHGPDAYVTTDDARRFPRPSAVHPNTAGSIFRCRGWTPMDGYDVAGNPIRAHASTVPGSHSNPLVRWRWTG